MPFEPEAAALFYALVAGRYERASMIVSLNKPFSAWTEIFEALWRDENANQRANRQSARVPIPNNPAAAQLCPGERRRQAGARQRLPRPLVPLRRPRTSRARPRAANVVGTGSRDRHRRVLAVLTHLRSQ